MTDREKLAKRIRAMASKTVENGCTEGEAIAAAEKLAAMLAEHNMTLDEASIRETPFTEHEEAHDSPVGDRLPQVATAIGFLTGARSWRSGAGVRPVLVTFFGFDHEVDVAKYLLAICERAMRDGEARTVAQFGLLVPARKRAKVAAFLDGMADSLSRRIRALKPKTPTGTGLIVLRDALIDAAIEEAGVDLKDMRGRMRRDRDPEYEKGLEAGARVALDKGLAGPTGMQRRIA